MKGYRLQASSSASQGGTGRSVERNLLETGRLRDAKGRGNTPNTVIGKDPRAKGSGELHCSARL